MKAQPKGPTMAILERAKPLIVICTRDQARAATFYRETLGLRQTGEDKFAAIFEIDGVQMRVSAVPGFKPHEHTILGFNVEDVVGALKALRAKGVAFNTYPGFGQDELGIWRDAETGTCVAWFNDPEGNVLSISNARKPKAEDLERNMTQADYYAMPSFVMLGVRDVVASARWYEALGFQNVFAMPGPGGAPLLVHLRWVRYADLLLRAEQSAATGPKGLGLTVNYMTPMADIDALFRKAKEAGATVASEIGNRPWNARDFTLADPDGFRITFTAGPVEQKLGIDEITKRRAGAKPAS